MNASAVYSSSTHTPAEDIITAEIANNGGSNKNEAGLESFKEPNLEVESTVAVHLNSGNEEHRLLVQQLLEQRNELNHGTVKGDAEMEPEPTSSMPVGEQQEQTTQPGNGQPAGKPFDRATFNPISKHAELQFEKAKNIFISCLTHGDFSNGPLTAEIIRFHLVPRCRAQLNVFIRQHGCHPYNTMVPISQIKTKKNRGRKTPVWYTSVSFTDQAQRQYFVHCQNDRIKLPAYTPLVQEYLGNPYPDSIKDLVPDGKSLDEYNYDNQFGRKRQKTENVMQPQIRCPAPFYIYRMPATLQSSDRLASLDLCDNMSFPVNPTRFIPAMRPQFIVASPQPGLHQNMLVPNVTLPVVVPASPVFHLNASANATMSSRPRISGESAIVSGQDLAKYSTETLFSFLKPNAALPILSMPVNDSKDCFSHKLKPSDPGQYQFKIPSPTNTRGPEHETSIAWQDFINTEHFDNDSSRVNQHGSLPNPMLNNMLLPSSENLERSRKTPPSREDIYSFPPLHPVDERNHNCQH